MNSGTRTSSAIATSGWSRSGIPSTSFLTFLGEWVAASLTIGAQWEDDDKQRMRLVWEALHLDSEVVVMLVDVLQLVFVDNHVCVSASALERTDLVGLVITTLLSAWGFKRFADSRWLTVGPSARAMVAASLTGLQGFLGWAKQKPHVSGYYLNGFWRMKTDHMTFLVITALCSVVPDTALKLVMTDNRLAMQVTKIKEAVRAKMQWMSEIPSTVWATLSTLTSLGAGELRSKCLRAAHTACAFMDFRAFSEVERLPWTLCRGDISENLETLRDGERPEEEVSGKVWDLMRVGYNKNQLTRMIQLLGDVPFSTAVTEQLHASAALVSRHHPDYGLGTLQGRAMVLIARWPWS